MLVVILLGGLLWATGRFGLIGAIAVVVSVSMLERMIVGFKVIRILRVTAADWVLLKDVGRVLLAAAAAAVVAAGTEAAVAPASPLLMVTATGAAFGVAYAGALAGLKILAPEEIATIERRLERLGLPLSLQFLSMADKRASGT